MWQRSWIRRGSSSVTVASLVTPSPSSPRWWTARWISSRSSPWRDLWTSCMGLRMVCGCQCMPACVHSCSLCVGQVWLFPAETFSDEVKKSLGNLYNEQRGECKIRLSGKDDLYTRLRDLHMQEIGPFVRRELAELQDYTITPHCYHPHSSLLPPSRLQPSLLPSSSLTAPTLTPHCSHPHPSVLPPSLLTTPTLTPHYSHPHSSLLPPSLLTAPPSS